MKKIETFMAVMAGLGVVLATILTWALLYLRPVFE
jgi:hypothetical protein